MCGRYTLTVDGDDLEARFDARLSDSGFEPRYNVAPGQELPVITNEEPSAFRRLEWGLVPSWADDDGGGLINARAESVAEKPSFREAYERRRCLVPADGFYEWVETDGREGIGDSRSSSGRGSDGGKQPYRVAFEDDRVFAMAGLWERWEPDATQTGLDSFGGGLEGETETGPLETFTIVTTEPNDLVSDLHHRMAVILDPDDERRWLSGEAGRELLEPRSADGMTAYPVSTAVNDPATDEPSLVEPVETT